MTCSMCNKNDNFCEEIFECGLCTKFFCKECLDNFGNDSPISWLYYTRICNKVSVEYLCKGYFELKAHNL